MRPSVNQVEYHIGLEDVDDGSRDRSIDASQEGYLDDSTGSLKSPAHETFRCTPASSACLRLEEPSGPHHSEVVELHAVVPAVIGVNRVGQLLLSRRGALQALARAWYRFFTNWCWNTSHSVRQALGSFIESLK